ncbi:MAG: hypothetical protein R2711_14620 [Acidimicrobiales bacterium]
MLVDDPTAVDLAAEGAALEAGFDGGMNVHFVAPAAGEADAMAMRVWERGAGITEACGTGATRWLARPTTGASQVSVVVHMPGGDVQVAVGDPMVLPDRRSSSPASW